MSTEMDMSRREDDYMDAEEDPSIYGGIDDSESEDSFAGEEGDVKEAREDIKLMNVVRAIVILVLLTLAFISAEAMFVITTINEEQNFQEGYAEAAGQLIEAFYERLDTDLWVAHTLSTDLTTQQNGAEWPFVTIKHFDATCEGPRQLTKASLITLDPLVESSLRHEWEEHMADFTSLTNQGEQEPTINVDDVSFHPTGRNLQGGIYRFEDGMTKNLESSSSASLFPISQVSPHLSGLNSGLVGILFEESSNPAREQALEDMIGRTGGVLSNFLFQDTESADFAVYDSPHSSLYYPVREAVGSPQVVATINMQLNWKRFFDNAIDDSLDAHLSAVVSNTCDGMFTFDVFRKNVEFLGKGDLHTVSDGYEVQETSAQAFADILNKHSDNPLDVETGCIFTVSVHPSQDFVDKFHTWRPEGFRAMILGSFFFVVLIFLIYDNLVERRQNRVVTAAKRSDTIVRSLFPSNIRDRLYEQAKTREEKAKNQREAWLDQSTRGATVDTQKRKLKRFMNHGDTEEGETGRRDEPIADLFPNTTIMFADIAGFTAWSSEREPGQVFTLLETIYRAMDKAAKVFGVFKVETVGDCYVAACGIPEPQAKHAEIMVRFARTTCVRIQQLTMALESQLGPGTVDLGMRFGLHSGPVTAGVLRGQKARFQLFGDTMNMAARIESNGLKNKIHISEATAEILVASGKGNWLIAREEKVHAKGKGSLQTYWVRMGQASTISDISDGSIQNDGSLREGGQPAQRRQSNSTNNFATKEIWEGTSLAKFLGKTEIDDRLDRLIDWNVELLLGLLKKIAAHHLAKGTDQIQLSPDIEKDIAGDLVLDEVQMVIPIPEFDPSTALKAVETEKNVELTTDAKIELRKYIACIASGYWDHPFHNFEHASHVILSANKLLNRIQNVDDDKFGDQLTSHNVHQHTFGIASDPLIQFAIVFSALVHDVGHAGISNAQLSTENPTLAEKYVHKSIAEQHSVDVAWDLLMLPAFKNLRACIYTDREGCERFRGLLVNSVMATDIFDKDLTALRTSRWEQSFNRKVTESPVDSIDLDRCATVVIEHIIQASDVSHTMQHWYIYQKWNERLYQEMYFAYLKDRSGTDPTLKWYEGEIWFFDTCILPLANRLKDCGVFGVSSEEFLNYAIQNRKEWEAKGRDVVSAMKQNADEKAERMNLARMDIVVEDGDVSSTHFGDDDGFDISVVGPTSPLRSINTVSPSRNLTADQRVVMAPPGRLGITIDTTAEGQIVHSVEKNSPLYGKLKVGEFIVAVNDVVTQSMSSHAISALLQASADHDKRFIVQS